MSYGAGSVGLNLQFCRYVFLFDRWWNPAVEDQAINRAHRIGVSGPVTVTRMLTHGHDRRADQPGAGRKARTLRLDPRRTPARRANRHDSERNLRPVQPQSPSETESRVAPLRRSGAAKAQPWLQPGGQELHHLGLPMSTSAHLRHLLARPGIVRSLAPHDVFTARVLEDVGVELLFLGGFGVSASVLGLPDLGLTTLTEMVEAVRRMTQRVSVPVIADGDTGHGDLHNVAWTVRQFESAGAAGILLEDQVAPKRCGHFAGKQVVSVETMVDKLRVALDARRDPDFVIIARTDARAIEGLDRAIERRLPLCRGRRGRRIRRSAATPPMNSRGSPARFPFRNSPTCFPAASRRCCRSRNSNESASRSPLTRSPR